MLPVSRGCWLWSHRAHCQYQVENVLPVIGLGPRHIRRTWVVGRRFGLKGAVNASIMWSNQVFFGLIMMGLPVVLIIGVSPAGSFPPVSRLEVFNGEVSFPVVGDSPAFVGV